MLFVGTSIIHPSTEGVFLLCNILDLLIYSMKRFSSTTLKTAFVKSIPIFCSYVFVSMAYGMMMASAGFPWYDSLLVSLTVYTGAFQFVLITFLSSGASLITIALTALLMNSRQSFTALPS